jgi:hypothetical protein
MCPDCKGKGEVQLLTSVVPCTCVNGFKKDDFGKAPLEMPFPKTRSWHLSEHGPRTMPKIDLYEDRAQREGISRAEAKRRTLAELYAPPRHFNCRNVTATQHKAMDDVLYKKLGDLLKEYGLGATMIDLEYRR